MTKMDKIKSKNILIMKKALLMLMCLAAMMATSTSLKAQEVALTLTPGYTWISCPMTDTIDFATALGSFIPMENDIIKSQRGLAVYLNGQWRGSISQFYPGKGYMYKSNRTEPVTVTFNALQPEPQGNVPEGAINSKFTINANGDRVYFSQGNLQYQASTNTWRYAENQWDYIGEANSNISTTYDGWIDLFGWGTSGFHNPSDSYNVNYQPWSTSDSEVNGDYNDYGYGPSMNMSDPCLTGTSANYDWGVYNPISNGGNAVGTWRTLTQPEWAYVLDTRSTVSGIRFAKAQVSDVNGVILLPDDWIADTYNLSNTNSISASFNSNVLSSSQWSIIESAGGVFLPASGGRYGTTVADVGSRGFYWLTSSNASCCAYYVYIYDSGIYLVNYKRYLGRSVRLVCPAE